MGRGRPWERGEGVSRLKVCCVQVPTPTVNVNIIYHNHKEIIITIKLKTRQGDLEIKSAGW